MRQAIAAGLAAVSGLDGWHIELVGGSRRHMRPDGAASQQEEQGEGQGQGPAADGGGGCLAAASCSGSASASAGSASPARSTRRRRHHDSDFMVTHSAGIWDDGLIERFRDWLIKQRRLVPPEDGAMTLLQVNPACSIGGPGHCCIWAPGRGFARGCVASMHAWPCSCRPTGCLYIKFSSWQFNLACLPVCLLFCHSLVYCFAAVLPCRRGAPTT